MDIAIGISERDLYSFKNGKVWNELYDFLKIRIRDWVSSTHLSLWRGQEEEIAFDILHESLASILTYILQYSLWVRNKEKISYNAIKSVSISIAYNHYQKQKRHDARFVSVRLRNHIARGYIAIYERADPLEMAITSTFQEWYCECLVGAIVKIPARPRAALLVHLANRTRFGTQLTLLLQSAFLKRDIHLQDYRQSLPHNPQERSEHEALLQIACGQIVKEQKQENHELLSGGEDFVLVDSSDVKDAENDLEFTSLIARLEATVPFPRPDLTFRENLRDKLLDILVEYQVSEKTAIFSSQTREPLVLQGNVGETNGDEEFALPGISYPDGCEGDPELAVLVAYLDAKTPLALIDPVFQEVLQEKLKNIPEEWHPAH